jgi:Flp pilus assembly protein TadB
VLDEITLVIGASFGGFLLLLIVGFYLIQHRNRNPIGSSATFENRDYYSQYGPKRAEQSKYSYQGSRRPFRSDAEIEENARRVRSNARSIMLVMIVLALAVIVVSSLFDTLYLILLIFLIPIAISFFRSSKRNRNRNTDQDPESRR